MATAQDKVAATQTLLREAAQRMARIAAATEPLNPDDTETQPFPPNMAALLALGEQNEPWRRTHQLAPSGSPSSALDCALRRRGPSSGVAPVSSSSAAGPGTPVSQQQRQQQPQQPVNERPEDMACDEATVEVLKRWLAIEKERKQSPCLKKQNVSWLLEHNRLH